MSRKGESMSTNIGGGKKESLGSRIIDELMDKIECGHDKLTAMEAKFNNLFGGLPLAPTAEKTKTVGSYSTLYEKVCDLIERLTQLNERIEKEL